MANIRLTAEAVKAVARRIKQISPDLKHTVIIDEIAQAFGWRGDALMHALKEQGDKEKIEPDAENRLKFSEFESWIDGQISGQEIGVGKYIDDDLIDIWFRVERYVDAKNGRNKQRLEQRGSWVIENGQPTRKLPDELKEQVKREFSELKNRLAALPPVNEDRIAEFLGKRRECSLQPAESIQEDRVICLLDGATKVMLSRHLKVKYDISSEEYRDLFQLPGDYPMTAFAYSAAKRAIVSPSSRWKEVKNQDPDENDDD